MTFLGRPPPQRADYGEVGERPTERVTIFINNLEKDGSRTLIRKERVHQGQRTREVPAKDGEGQRRDRRRMGDSPGSGHSKGDVPPRAQNLGGEGGQNSVIKRNNSAK